MKELFQMLVIVGFLIFALVVMILSAGWYMTAILLALLATPILVFGVLPYLLESRPHDGRGELFRIIGRCVVVIIALVVMILNAGWATTGFILALLAAPILVFGVLPYLLGSRPCNGNGSGGKSGYYYSYDYKYGAKHRHK